MPTPRSCKRCSKRAAHGQWCSLRVQGHPSKFNVADVASQCEQQPEQQEQERGKCNVEKGELGWPAGKTEHENFSYRLWLPRNRPRRGDGRAWA